MNGSIEKQDYIELELLNQQLTELDESIQLAKEQLDHTAIAKSMLEELKTTKEGADLLVPLGSGIFLNVKATTITDVNVAVGAGVVVKKSVDDAVAYVQQQSERLESFQNKSLELYDKVASRALSLQEKIEREMKGN